MGSIAIRGNSNDSTVMIGESIKHVSKYVPQADSVIITDINVYRHYQEAFPTGNVIQIGTGEKIENLDTGRTPERLQRDRQTCRHRGSGFIRLS